MSFSINLPSIKCVTNISCMAKQTFNTSIDVYLNKGWCWNKIRWNHQFWLAFWKSETQKHNTRICIFFLELKIDNFRTISQYTKKQASTFWLSLQPDSRLNSLRTFLHPWKINHVPYRATISIENTSSNHWFSGGIVILPGSKSF